MWDQRPSFRFEIDNFLDKKAVITSKDFVAGRCEWYLAVHKGDNNDQLCLFLYVANRNSLRTGWKRSAKYYFHVLNESNQELYKSSILGKKSMLFCAENPAWGTRKTLPLSKFQEKGFLENNKLIIEVYINVVEAFDGEGGEDINGFQVFAAHVASMKKKFAEHVVKTEYKNTLRNACSKLNDLAEVGAKLDWLKSKFDEVSFKRKNADDGADEKSLIQQLEERIKNLELMVSDFQKDCLKSKSKMKKLHAADECRFQKLEESVKNLELMELGLKLNSLESKLEEVSLETKKADDADDFWGQLLEERVIELRETASKMESLKLKLEEIALERKKSYDADESRVQQLEERIKNIELMDLGFKLDCVNTKVDNADESRVQQIEERVRAMSMEMGFMLNCLDIKIEEVSLERKKSDDARFQQLEETANNIELMVSCLKVELGKKKDKSSDDGFLLIN